VCGGLLLQPSIYHGTSMRFCSFACSANFFRGRFNAARMNGDRPQVRRDSDTNSVAHAPVFHRTETAPKPKAIQWILRSGSKRGRVRERGQLCVPTLIVQNICVRFPNAPSPLFAALVGRRIGSVSPATSRSCRSYCATRDARGRGRLGQLNYWRDQIQVLSHRQ
jgi:hypothetical protein